MCSLFQKWTVEIDIFLGERKYLRSNFLSVKYVIDPS